MKAMGGVVFVYQVCPRKAIVKVRIVNRMDFRISPSFGECLCRITMIVSLWVWLGSCANILFDCGCDVSSCLKLMQP